MCKSRNLPPVLRHDHIAITIIKSITDNLWESPDADVLAIHPWIQGQFIRLGRYWDGYLGFGGATAMLCEDRIRVCNSYGNREIFPLTTEGAIDASTFMLEV